MNLKLSNLILLILFLNHAWYYANSISFSLFFFFVCIECSSYVFVIVSLKEYSYMKIKYIEKEYLEYNSSTENESIIVLEYYKKKFFNNIIQ